MNIQRQPNWPFHDWRMTAAVAPSGTFCGNQPVDDLGRKDAEDDRQLVDRHQPPADVGGRDLRNVHRRQIRGQADGHAADDPPGHEPDERGAQPVSTEEMAKERGGGQQQLLPPQLVAQRAGQQRADQASQQGATVGPADQPAAVKLKVLLEKRLGAADHHPVVAEQQAAHGGHQRDEPDISQVVSRAVGSGRQRFIVRISFSNFTCPPAAGYRGEESMSADAGI